MSVELITAATGASTVSAIRVYGENVPCTLIASGLAGAEVMELQIEGVSGGYEDVYWGGTKQELTATITTILIEAPGLYQVVKGVTVGASGLYMSSEAHQ